MLPATPTGTTHSAVDQCGQCALQSVLKVSHSLSVCSKDFNEVMRLFLKCKKHDLFCFILKCLFFQDDENTTEHTPTHHMLQPPQAVFPACICAAVLPIVHLMEDGDIREDGVAGTVGWSHQKCILYSLVFFLKPAAVCS